MAQKFDRRGKSLNPNKLRNLPQYRDKTEEELNAIIGRKEEFIDRSETFEKQIEETLAKYENDYDLSDLKINDRAVLRGLIQSIISLEQYEQDLFQLRGDGINPENVLAIQKLQNVMSELRGDISKMQNDLAITRRHRKSDQEQSVIAYIEHLKEQSKKFIEAKHAYIFCPKCHTLLATQWSL